MCSAQPVSLGEQDRARDRLELGHDRPRGEPVARRRPERAGGQRVVLGVHGDRQPEPGGDRHALVERDVVDVGELVDARVRHERLQADHAALGELLEPVEVAGHEAAPEAEVDARRGPRRLELGVEGGAVEHRRRRVQRHVEERREAARGQRGAAGREPFPVRAAGLVEVHVRVQPAGQDEQAARVELLARAGQLRLDGRDQAVGDRRCRAASPRTIRSNTRTSSPRRSRAPRRPR